MFKLNKGGGSYQVLHYFAIGDGLVQPETDSLIEGNDGSLYGATYSGGSSGLGGVFKINRDGSAYTILHSFQDGDGVLCRRLVDGGNGVLYGITAYSGVFWVLSVGSGTVFSLNKDGTGFTVLHTFSSTAPEGGNGASLLMGSDGSLYGTTADRYGGTVFRLGNRQCLPISFFQHPQSSTNAPGTSVTLSANVEGTPPFHYQWLYQGIFPVGGDSNSVTITNLNFTNLGSYYVDVTNCWGLRVRSFPAFVSMSTTNYPPNLNYQPSDATVREGQTARFDVGLYGNEPVGIWWKHNGALIPGAASASLVLSNVALSAAGNYQLFATNAYGSTNSRLATLTMQTNARPLVAITSPAGGSTFQAPTNLPIQVTASDPDGTLLGVELFADGRRIAALNQAPYDFTYFSKSPGTHVFTVVATDNYGAQTAASVTSAFVRPPLVSTQPASGIAAVSANLNGNVVPNGVPATVYFRYGTNTSFGSFASAGVLATSSTFSSPIASLRPGTTYYFEAVASNVVGIAFGGSQSFVTSLNAEAGLAGLTLSAGPFTPAFAPAITSYSANLSATVSNVTVTPTSTDGNATIRVRVNGGSFGVVSSGSPSGLLTINPGISVIEVKVTAQDGVTMRTYSLTIGSGYTFTTLAGAVGSTGTNDGSGIAARFNTPSGLAVDSVGNMYVTDSGNHTIRKATPEGVVTTLAGLAGQTGSANGTGSVARFNTPNCVAADIAGNLYVTEWVNNTVRKVTPGGVVTTLAGTPGLSGSADGTGGAARFTGPNGVAVDSTGNVWVADFFNQTIRKITPGGVVTTLAGLVGSTGTNDGAGTAARFNNPNGAAVDSAGNFYVSDELSHTIRKVTPAGVVTTVAGSAGNLGSVDGAGSSVRFSHPGGLAVDPAGNLFVADWYNSILRRITPDGTVVTVAGLAGNPGSADGTGSAARFAFAAAIAADSVGNLYVAEYANHTLRKGWPSVGGASPTILSQPQDQTVATGYPASFSLVAVGTGMLTYQ